MIHTQRIPLAIWYAVLLHLIWGVGLLVDPSAAGVTAVHSVVTAFTLYGTIAAFFIVAVLAAVALLYDNFLSVFMILPQQFVLMISAGGALDSMIHARFADGTLRPHWFLIVDQLPALLAVTMHTIALIQIARGKWIRR